MSDLYETEFIKLLFEKVHESKVIKNIGTEDNSEIKQYILDVFLITSQLLSSLESLGFIVDILENYHPELNKKVDIRQLTTKFTKEIKYHIENYYIRSTKIKDQILLLINQLYELNLKEYDCRYEKVFKMLKKEIESRRVGVKAVLLLTLIEEFKDSFKSLDSYRNFITHNGDYSEENFNLAHTFLYLRDLKNKDKKYEEVLMDGMSEFEFSIFLKNAVVKRISDFNRLSNNLHDWVYQLFLLLEIEFVRKLKEKS